jgi:hypothetical protein
MPVMISRVPGHRKESNRFPNARNYSGLQRLDKIAAIDKSTKKLVEIGREKKKIGSTNAIMTIKLIGESNLRKVSNVGSRSDDRDRETRKRLKDKDLLAIFSLAMRRPCGSRNRASQSRDLSPRGRCMHLDHDDDDEEDDDEDERDAGGKTRPM